MLAKILIGVGILMIVVGFAPVVWGIYKILTEPAGIGAGSGIMYVLFVFAGIILVAAGAIKLRGEKKSQTYL